MNDCLNKEVEERLQYKYIESTINPEKHEMQGMQEEYKGIKNLSNRVFDFYGHHIRINENDKEKFINNVLLREKEAEIESLHV